MKNKIKKGDIVEVVAGNDRGATGRVMVVYPKKGKILVEGVNISKKHARPTQNNPKGGIQDKEMPVNYSNVMIIDSEKQRTRIGIRFEEKGDKRTSVRYSKKNENDL